MAVHPELLNAVKCTRGVPEIKLSRGTAVISQGCLYSLMSNNGNVITNEDKKIAFLIQFNFQLFWVELFCLAVYLLIQDRARSLERVRTRSKEPLAVQLEVQTPGRSRTV
jgi:hypothetical protein